MKSINNYISFSNEKISSIDDYINEKLVLTKRNNVILPIADMLEIFHQVMGMLYTSADEEFIAALEEFCNCVTSLDKIEIHTNGMKNDCMYKVERKGNAIKIYADGHTNFRDLSKEFYNNGKVRSVDFNLEANPLDEFLDINDEEKMFYYGSMEGDFIFIV
jgi:hypothetical protein